MKASFQVLSTETRSDNPALHGYKVRFNSTSYIIYYNETVLKEVYFVGRFKNYLFSCRPDFKTISHYYYKTPDETNNKPYIKRYENGICNRIYTIETPQITTCTVDDALVTYITTPKLSNKDLERLDQEKIREDLVAFLDQFIELKLYKLFNPVEPVNSNLELNSL